MRAGDRKFASVVGVLRGILVGSIMSAMLVPVVAFAQTDRDRHRYAEHHHEYGDGRDRH